MPLAMCEKPETERETCWNGYDAASYDGKVVEDGVASQVENPEVPVSLNGSNVMISEQKFKLQSLTNVLKSAYRGQDIEWWDDEEEVVEGSGASPLFYDYTDDEDGFGSGDMDPHEGSGGLEDDDEDPIIVPSWTANKEEDAVNFGEEENAWNPWPKFSSSAPSTTTPRPGTTGGTSSIHLKSRWAVAKAVLTYSLPMITCYFGGFLTDVPWVFQ